MTFEITHNENLCECKIKDQIKKHVTQVNSIEGRVSGDMNRTELIISKVDHSCNWKVTSLQENNSSMTKSITFIPDE